MCDFLYRLCGWIDNIPYRTEGRWYRGLGCRLGIARLACDLELRKNKRD